MLKAKVVRIESGSKFTDGGQRVTLRFEAADIVERYKECSKDDKRDELSVGVRVGVR